MTDWQTVSFTIDTPMFLRGANQGMAEFRIPSLRGALRYWFRAHAGLAFADDQDLIGAAEATLFGSAGDGGSGKSSGVRFRSAQINPPQPADWLNNHRGVKYLVGPAIAGGDLPAHLRPGTTGSFEVRCKVEKQLPLVGLCLATLSHFGGLGARVRRGFGGIRFLGLDELCPGIEAVLAADDGACGLFARFCSLVEKPDATPNPAAISDHPSFSSWKGQRSAQMWGSPLSALDAVGLKFDMFRSPIDRNLHGWTFADINEPRRWASNEYAEIIDPMRYGQVRPAVPTFKLGAFGLPIGFAHDNKASIWRDDDELRRASPLWIRPLRVNDHEWRVLYHVFRSTLWPDSATLEMRGHHRSIAMVLDEPTAYAKIDEWLAEAP